MSIHVGRSATLAAQFTGAWTKRSAPRGAGKPQRGARQPYRRHSGVAAAMRLRPCLIPEMGAGPTKLAVVETAKSQRVLGPPEAGRLITSLLQLSLPCIMSCGLDLDPR